MPEEDHSTDLSRLISRYPDWTIWYGPATGHWWALPPRDHDIGDFVEAADPTRLIIHIEHIRAEPPAHRDAAGFLLTAPPLRRVPLAARPGDQGRAPGTR